MFDSSFDFDFSNERIAIEILAAVEHWQISQFKTKFQQTFIDEFNDNSIRLVYPAALYYGLSEICDAFTSNFPHSKLLVDKLYRPRKCFVSVSPYVEPKELSIPLHNVKHTLNDNFNRDISNVITFEAVEGSYMVTGFHIMLNIDDNKNDFDSMSLDAFYNARNLHSGDNEEMKISKRYRSIVVINFKQKFAVNQGQKLEISIDAYIKPYLCFAANETRMEERSKDCEFSLKLASTYKVGKSGGKRFFVGKVLYYGIADTFQ